MTMNRCFRFADAAVPGPPAAWPSAPGRAARITWTARITWVARITWTARPTWTARLIWGDAPVRMQAFLACAALAG
jgi:hypothetical protein